MVETLELVGYPDLESRIEALERDGVVYFPGILDAEEVAEVVEETAAGVDRDGTRGVGTRRGARERTDVDAWKGARPFSTMPDPEILVPESSASSSRVMLGLVYNRAASVRDGIRGNPLEIRIVFREVVGGSGGNVPNARSLEAGFRFFVGVWGG